MRILFISSGNNKYGISPIVKAQGVSLIEAGINIDFFTIKGKGVFGYLKNLPRLIKTVRSNNYDLVHAHYSFCGFMAFFSGHKNVICSLMGSDIQVKGFLKNMISFFSIKIWKKTIVKSEYMKNKTNLMNSYVIPNGVNLDKFLPNERQVAKRIVEFDSNKKQIVWVSNPERYEKNFELAKKAVDELNEGSIELKPIYDVTHEEIINFMNAADMLLLTSRWEGSPNVIKEAMALNIPIVSTDVGDVKEIIGSTEGCFIVEQSIESVSAGVNKCLNYNKRTDGRNRLSDFDSKQIAQRIVILYKECLKYPKRILEKEKENK